VDCFISIDDVLACRPCELAFLLDSAQKADANAWTDMLTFVSQVVRRYSINQNCVRVAVIRYSNTADAPIRLNTYSDVNRLVQAIGQIQLLGGSTSNLNTALDLLRTQVFQSTIVRGSAARNAIIVTDTLQQNNPITTAANNAKRDGIILIGVAITRIQRVDVNYFSTIVSNRWVVQVGDYNQLSGAVNTIVTQYACPAATPAPPVGGMYVCYCFV